MSSPTKSEFSIKEKNLLFFSDDIYSISNEKSLRKQLDLDIEREIAQNFFNILQTNNSADFLTIHISLLFETLGIAEDFSKLTVLKHYKNITIDSQNNSRIVDFDKLLHYVHKLLIFMENQITILEYWKLVLFNIPLKRAAIEKQPNLNEVNWFLEIINVKEMKSIEEMDKINSSNDSKNDKANKKNELTKDSQIFVMALKMIKVASTTESLYITYLDFAHLLGKLGLLDY